MAESTPSLQEEVFIVRGHHVTRLFNVVAMGMGIEEVLDDAQFNAPEPFRGYREDVFGNTTEEADGARIAQRKFFSDFMELPDGAVVRFVAGQKDAICGSCVVGNHCNTTSPKADDTFLRAIGRLAREKGLEDFLVEGTVEVQGWKKPSPILELPAWAARRIISDIDFHAQTLPRIIRPLARQAVRREMKRR